MRDSHTPCRLRRQGRDDFDPSVEDPMSEQPFTPGSFWYDSDLAHWLDGWAEAKDDHEEALKEGLGEEDGPWAEGWEERSGASTVISWVDPKENLVASVVQLQELMEIVQKKDIT